MRSFRRGWAAACAAAYFVTNVAAAHAVEKSLWEERRTALRRTTWGARGAPVALLPLAGSLPVFDGGSTPSQPPSNFFKAAVPFDAASAALPYGTVSEMREGRPGAPVVFLVQDVHGNDGAQKNIGGLLGELSARGVTLTGVEGAWSSIDLGAFHRHPSPQSVSLVADALRAAGRLSGSEWAGLTAPHPPTLVGVESPDLYQANVAAARDCVARRPTVETFLKNLRYALQIQKDRFYSPQLKSFDLHIKDYHEGREGLAVYARYLTGLPGSGSQSGPQVKKFLKAMDWESRLNFEKVEADRRALMDRLTRDLERRELDGLLSQAVAYRTGKQTNGDFFFYLKTLCSKTRIPLASYQSFAGYIAYVGLVQSINRADLLNELAVWETGLAASLAKTPEERRLVAMDRDVSLLRQLLENEMSPDAWAQFNKRRNEIVALPARLREFGDFQEPQEGMAAFFRSHEEFCRLAMARNGALVSNLMSQIQSRKASQAVLVAGGFHTPGLQSELMKRGCSTVVVTPRIEKVEGKPLDVFARDPLPFDHLFAGKPISLPAELLVNDEGRALILGGKFSAEALANPRAGDLDDKLKKWLEDQGFIVTLVTRSTEGLVRLEVVLRGIPLVLLSGPEGVVESAKIPTGSQQETTILPNGHCVLTYVQSPATAQTFWDLIRQLARSVGPMVLNGVRWLVPSGQGTASVGMTWLGPIFSVLLPAKWISEMRVIPESHSIKSDSKNTPDGQGTPDALSPPVKITQFHSSRQGLAVRVSLTDLSGKEVASAIVSGKRGEIVFQGISIEPGETNYAYGLIAGAVKEFLLLKGQGRVLLREVIDPQVKRVAKEMFGDNLVMAPKGFGRSLNGPWTDAIDPSSEGFHRLLEDPSALVDLAGTLTPEARQSLWPNEELLELVTATTPAPSVQVNFIPVRDQSRITENLPPGFADNDLYDVEIDGMVVGTAVFSETALALRLSDLNIPVEHRRKGYARAVYESLAKRAALILSPELNKNGPVPFNQINIANPITFQIGSELCEPNSIEIVDVGSRASDKYFTSSVAWTTSSMEGSGQFEALVGLSNIETKGPNSGKYRRHFDFRGRPNRAITEEAEREFLQAQLANPIGALSSPHPSFNGLAFLGGGFPFDPLIGLTVATIFLGAMLFKSEILKWLERRAPPPVYEFVNKFLPPFRFSRETVQQFIEKLMQSPLVIPHRFNIMPGDSKSSVSRSGLPTEESVQPFDPRPVNNGLLAEPYARYAELVRRIVNPQGGPFTVLYGGAGADLSQALLMTQFTRAFFISPTHGLTIDDLNQIRDGKVQVSAVYAGGKYKDGYADLSHLSNKESLLSSLATELQSMGVSFSLVKSFLWEGNPGIQFNWQAPGESFPRMREIIFVDRDIVRPETYSDVLGERFDLYLQRAGAMIPWNYNPEKCFIHAILRSMKPGAFFATDDFAMDFNGKFIDLAGRFPLQRPIIPVPGELQLLSQAIDIRYEGDPPGENLSKENLEGYGLLLRIREAFISQDSREISLTPDEGIMQALDYSRSEGTYYAALARYFRLNGSVVDLGVANGAAQGLLGEGVSDVFILTSISHSPSNPESGVHSVPGHATSLSHHLGVHTMDAIIINKSLPRLMKGPEAKESLFGQEWKRNLPDEEMDIGFELDVLSRIILEANRALKEGGRIIITFSPQTAIFTYGQWHFLGWDLKELLEEKGFDSFQAMVSKNGVLLISALAKPREQTPDSPHAIAPSFPTDNSRLMHDLPGNFQEAILVSQRKVSDPLDEEERKLLSRALVKTTPSYTDMGSVEFQVNPDRMSTAESFSGAFDQSETGSPKLSELEKMVTERLTQPTRDAISWAGDLALQKLGQEALSGAAEKAMQRGEALVAGAALAALDDGLRYPHGPIPEKMKGAILALNQGRTETLIYTANTFADSYNQMRYGLLHRRLLGAHLRGAGVLVDLTALFEEGSSPETNIKKDQTWAALAGVLVANRQNMKSPVGLVVRNPLVSRLDVENELKKMVPTWEKGRVTGDALILASEEKSKPQ